LVVMPTTVTLRTARCPVLLDSWSVWWLVSPCRHLVPRLGPDRDAVGGAGPARHQKLAPSLPGSADTRTWSSDSPTGLSVLGLKQSVHHRTGL